MPKCPYCKAEINELKEYGTETFENSLYFDDNGDEHYEELGVMEDNDKSRGFFCPECDEKLFDTKEQAIIFLKTKK
ncbi:MAG: hypothetical protein QXZ12_06960 [Thermoplasmata archaeon]